MEVRLYASPHRARYQAASSRPALFSERIALGTRLVLAFTDFSFFYPGFYTFIFVAQLDGLVRDTSSSKTTFV